MRSEVMNVGFSKVESSAQHREKSTSSWALAQSCLRDVSDEELLCVMSIEKRLFFSPHLIIIPIWMEGSYVLTCTMSLLPWKPCIIAIKNSKMKPKRQVNFVKCGLNSIQLWCMSRVNEQSPLMCTRNSWRWISVWYKAHIHTRLFCC